MPQRACCSLVSRDTGTARLGRAACPIRSIQLVWQSVARSTDKPYKTMERCIPRSTTIYRVMIRNWTLDSRNLETGQILAGIPEEILCSHGWSSASTEDTPQCVNAHHLCQCGGATALGICQECRIDSDRSSATTSTVMHPSRSGNLRNHGTRS